TYTFIDAEFRKGPFKENTLPGVPEHRVTANVTYEVLPKLFLSLDWLLVQDFFRINDFNNVIPGDNYGVLNLGARFEHERFSVYARIENVTNEEYTTFQSSNGLITSTGENPAPPISFLLGLTLKF
ncbi:MAG: TonB-dependent receptor, partial [candidate division NC10 bacterium]